MKHRTGISKKVAVAMTLAASLTTINACGSVSESGSSTPDWSVPIGNKGPLDESKAMSDLCGTKPATIGVVDGLGSNSWSKHVRAEVEDEAGMCSNITLKYVDALGDLSKQNSAISSLNTQGADIILVLPNAGPGEAALPSMRAATQAGVIVSPMMTDPGGEPGVDYFDYVDTYQPHDAALWANWMVEALGPEGGNVVYLGGPAGNSASKLRLDSVKEVFADHPDVELIAAVDTNWDTASTQQAMSGLLAKYPTIDGIIGDSGFAMTGAFRALQVADRPLVPLATIDANVLSCGFSELKKEDPRYELMTTSSRTWAARIAMRKAMAQLQGLEDDEPSLVLSDPFEDTLSSDQALAPENTCIPGVPNDAFPSSQLSSDQLTDLFSQ